MQPGNTVLPSIPVPTMEELVGVLDVVAASAEYQPAEIDGVDTAVLRQWECSSVICRARLRCESCLSWMVDLEMEARPYPEGPRMALCRKSISVRSAEGRREMTGLLSGLARLWSSVLTLPARPESGLEFLRPLQKLPPSMLVWEEVPGTGYKLRTGNLAEYLLCARFGQEWLDHVNAANVEAGYDSLLTSPYVAGLLEFLTGSRWVAAELLHLSGAPQQGPGMRRATDLGRFLDEMDTTICRIRMPHLLVRSALYGLLVSLLGIDQRHFRPEGGESWD